MKLGPGILLFGAFSYLLKEPVHAALGTFVHSTPETPGTAYKILVFFLT
jgi:hypothetical protein